MLRYHQDSLHMSGISLSDGPESGRVPHFRG
jgi:hypothetical protein